MDDWLTVEEAAQLANYHPDHIRRLLRAGTLAGKKWGQAWMISKSDLEDHLKKKEGQGERRGRKKEI